MTLVVILAFCGYLALVFWLITRPTVYGPVWPFDLYGAIALYDCDDGNETVVEIESLSRLPWIKPKFYRIVKRHDLGKWFWDTGAPLTEAPDHVWELLEACLKDKRARV